MLTFCVPIRLYPFPRHLVRACYKLRFAERPKFLCYYRNGSVLDTLRVWAAGEISCIEYAGLYWGDCLIVELPLHIAELLRVAEGEQHRLGTFLRQRECYAART